MQKRCISTISSQLLSNPNKIVSKSITCQKGSLLIVHYLEPKNKVMFASWRGGADCAELRLAPQPRRHGGPRLLHQDRHPPGTAGHQQALLVVRIRFTFEGVYL